MQIGDIVRRQNRDGSWTRFEIKTQAELEYHKGLKEDGFKYVTVVDLGEAGCAACEA